LKGGLPSADGWCDDSVTTGRVIPDADEHTGWDFVYLDADGNPLHKSNLSNVGVALANSSGPSPVVPIGYAAANTVNTISGSHPYHPRQLGEEPGVDTGDGFRSRPPSSRPLRGALDAAPSRRRRRARGMLDAARPRQRLIGIARDTIQGKHVTDATTHPQLTRLTVREDHCGEGCAGCSLASSTRRRIRGDRTQRAGRFVTLLANSNPPTPHGMTTVADLVGADCMKRLPQPLSFSLRDLPDAVSKSALPMQGKGGPVKHCPRRLGLLAQAPD
jgi:hypothetical protein